MFALRLKELREKRGLSQKAFATKLGVSQSTVGMWESKKREPNFKTAETIASFFNVTTDYLLARTDEITPKPDSVELENDVIIYNRNGKIVKRKMSKEKMDMLASMIDAIPEDNNPDL